MGDDLNDLEQKYILAGEYGYQLQKEGVKIVRAAEKGLEVIKFIKNEHKDHLDPGTQAWLASANASIPAYPPDNIKQVNSYSLVVGVTTSTAGAIFFDEIYPKSEYELADEELRELDSFLEEFSRAFGDLGDLASMRRGAWQTFHSPVDNALMTASHSMREILSKIISQLGSDKALKETGANPTSKKKTGKERLGYLFSRGAAKEMAEMATNKCYEAYNRLKEIAHGSSGEREEVKRYMRMTEQALLSILQAWKLRSKRTGGPAHG